VQMCCVVCAEARFSTSYRLDIPGVTTLSMV